MKTCPCCNRQLPATETFFDADADYPDGLTVTCWRCNREKIGDVKVYAGYVAIDEPARAIVPIKRVDALTQSHSRRYSDKLESIRSAARAALNR